MEEIWKDISGYNGKYQVSNLGRVKSYAQDPNNGKVKIGNRTAKGYLTFLLYDENGDKKWCPVHRLVASAFIDNPHHLPQVNHKDENKENNRADNLEWCTNEYNAAYGTKPDRMSKANRCHKSTSLKICSVDPSGKVECYASIGEAERQTGISHSNIIRNLKGRTHRCGNRKWFYC